MDRNGSVREPGRSTDVLVWLSQTEYVYRKDHPEGNKGVGGSRTRWEYSECGKAAHMGKQRDRLR
jgi:hypothetical protein